MLLPASAEAAGALHHLADAEAGVEYVEDHGSHDDHDALEADE